MGLGQEHPNSSSTFAMTLLNGLGKSLFPEPHFPCSKQGIVLSEPCLNHEKGARKETGHFKAVYRYRRLRHKDSYVEFH